MFLNIVVRWGVEILISFYFFDRIELVEVVVEVFAEGVNV